MVKIPVDIFIDKTGKNNCYLILLYERGFDLSHESVSIAGKPYHTGYIIFMDRNYQVFSYQDQHWIDMDIEFLNHNRGKHQSYFCIHVFVSRQITGQNCGDK